MSRGHKCWITHLAERKKYPENPTYCLTYSHISLVESTGLWGPTEFWSRAYLFLHPLKKSDFGEFCDILTSTASLLDNGPKCKGS